MTVKLRIIEPCKGGRHVTVRHEWFYSAKVARARGLELTRDPLRLVDLFIEERFIGRVEEQRAA